MQQTNPKTERQQAHALLDVLPDEQIGAVRSLLAVMVEPLSSSLATAPLDEEELTPETIAALESARVSLASGNGVSHNDILREFACG